MTNKHETQEALEMIRGLLRLDPITGVLVWRVQTGRGRRGVLVGTPHNRKGHRATRVAGRAYMVHRIVFALHNGRWPAGQVDHKNGDASDNRPSNLREATHAQNCMNRRSCSRLGLPKGVAQQKNGRFQARIGVARRLISLGTFDTPEAAHAAYMTAAREHFGDFARAA